MSHQRKLRGLYVITDDVLTPDDILFIQVEDAIKGGAKIVQLRDKKSSDEQVEKKAIRLQQLCKKHNVLFVLNDKIDLAIKLQCDGLHIGKSDHDNFIKIRENFDGIIGVSCYGDINKARHFELLGADYVAFGSFYASPTKPDSNIVPLETIQLAKEKLGIAVCVIGGINSSNLDEIMSYKPDMVSVISDIWNSSNIKNQAKKYTKKI
jgi:thiamine-phosphate pyrophosphorylase